MLSPERLPRLPRCLSGLGVVALALLCGPGTARCEVSVQGTIEAVRIQARKAPLPEVLKALETSFKVRQDAFISLDGMVVTGTYSGTLDDVLRRVLTGLNYVIMTEKGTVDLIIVGRWGEAPAAEDRPLAAPANTNPAAQWRRSALQKP